MALKGYECGDVLNYGLKIKLPFSALIAGPSGSGKTYFVKTVLSNMNHVMDIVPDNIVWIYSSYQSLYDELQKQIKITFIDGIPESFCDEDLFPSGKSHLIILDDVMSDAADHPEVVKIFTEYRHHRNISVMMLSQNIFHQGKHSRTISLNCGYLVLFKNPRDKLQINVLAQQMFPSNKKYFLQSYEDATRQAHKYLFVDLTQDCPELARLRAGILPGEELCIYIPTQKCPRK